MPDLLDSLPTFADSGIKPFYDDNVGRRDVVATVADDLRYARRAASRKFIDATRVANAARQLDQLPEDAETIHCIMRGNFDAWHWLPAIIGLADTTVETLNIATLGFNEKNANELIGMLDRSEVKHATFLCAHFWKTHDGPLYDSIATELAKRGCPALAARTHAKVQCLEMSDGRCYVIESSANLRSCRNVEQTSITRDRGLLLFHRGWMLDMIGVQE